MQLKATLYISCLSPGVRYVEFVIGTKRDGSFRGGRVFLDWLQGEGVGFVRKLSVIGLLKR